MSKKKGMSEDTKENLKNVFGSLISNQRAIDGARHNPWWVALIMFCLGVFLPVIPILTTTCSAYGSSFLASKTMGFDTSIARFVEDLNANDVDMIINDNGTLSVTGWDDAYGSQYSHVNDNTGEYDFIAAYYPGTTSEWSNFVNNEMLVRQYIKGTTNGAVEETTTADRYNCTFVCFGTYDIYTVVYYQNSPSSSSTNYRISSFGYQKGDYTHTAAGTNIKDFYGTPGNYPVANFQTEVDSIFATWKTFMNESYETTKGNNITIQTLMALGIYIVLGIFMGLMVFLLTRGKKNIFRVLSFWTCEKITAWAMPAPAILAMILGFFLSSYAIVFFIILLGTRIMWMSMKQLKPEIR